MWPCSVDWHDLRFGVEIEFIGGDPESVELLPGWIMSFDERQIDETGTESGSELKPPPMLWEDRDQIREMLTRLQAQGAAANWSCGLHVHVGLDPWGEPIVIPLIEAALSYQGAIQALLGTSGHRLIFCPPVTEEMLHRYNAAPGGCALRHRGRPQSHRCGINAAAWYDCGTVEIRYANGSLDYDEVLNTIELCLRFVAAIGAGRKLPCDAAQLAIELGAPVAGYPLPAPCPRWHKERTLLEEALIPRLTPLIDQLVKDGEIHHIVPVAEGFLVAVEKSGGELRRFVATPPASGWELLRVVEE